MKAGSAGVDHKHHRLCVNLLGWLQLGLTKMECPLRQKFIGTVEISGRLVSGE